MALIARSRLGVLTFTFAAAASGLVLYACGGDDSTSGATTAGNDASTAGDSTTSDGSIATDSGNPNDASTTTDSGKKNDGGVSVPAPPITGCTTTVRVDTLGKALPQALAAGSFNGKYAFTWSDDNGSHQRVRYFNGTAFTTEIDLGAGEAEPAFSGVDSAGKMYILRDQSGSTAARDVFDLTTGALAVPTAPTPFHISDITSYSLGALPQGALALYQVTGPTNEIADLYTPGKGWSNGGDAGIDAGGPFALTHSTAEVAHVALNASGKGALVWAEDGSSGDNLIHINTFDGTKAGPTLDRDVPTGAYGVTAAALSNGDIALAWIAAAGSATPNVSFTVFHPAAAVGSQFDADLNLGAWVLGGGYPIVLADPHDNVTVVWINDGAHVVAKKRIGTTWSSSIPIGTSAGAVAVLDPNGNVIAVTENGSHIVQITRMPIDATAFGPLVSTTMPSSNNPYVAFAFNAAGDPVTAVWGSYSSDTQIWAATCANGL